jgi:mono/diheme cytochrome c family protein
MRFCLVRWISVVLLTISFAVAESANSPQSGSGSKSIASGKALFMQHCASCHGDDAKGAGPGAVALKVQPPDLTALAKRNHGKFPYQEVYKAIDGNEQLAAHGSREMPVWGPLFLALSGVNRSEAEKRITNLTNYIKSLQVK